MASAEDVDEDHIFKGGGKGGRKSFKVVVRVRPKIERESKCQMCVNVTSKSKIVVTKTPDCKSTSERPSTSKQQCHEFGYDRVFDTESSQDDVFSTAVRPVVQSVLEGYNGSIIAYGQTGTGKTHTIEGSLKGDDRGIIPRTAHEIFDYIHDAAEAASQWLVRVSYLQIYNEKIFDLLNEHSKDSLRIRESADGGVYVETLTEHVVRSATDVYNLLLKGKAQRTTAQTRLNRESSRSHAVFTVIIEHSTGSEEAPNVTVGKLHLVDLAGSERYNVTDDEKHQKETQNINVSLSAFGKVVLALTSRSQSAHTPYRDSKLTRILQDSLGGNCKTTMITTVSPASVSYLETVNSLKFSNRAKSVKNVAVVNEDKSESAMLSAYQTEISRLRRMLKQGQGNGHTSSAPAEAIASQLAQREQEVQAAQEAKQLLQQQIEELQGKLLSGGTRIEETDEFQEAVSRERERLQKEQSEKVKEIEAERARLQREKDDFERERHQFAMRSASMTAVAASRFKRGLQPGAGGSTPPSPAASNTATAAAAVVARPAPPSAERGSSARAFRRASDMSLEPMHRDSSSEDEGPTPPSQRPSTSYTRRPPLSPKQRPPAYGTETDPWALVRNSKQQPEEHGSRLRPTTAPGPGRNVRRSASDSVVMDRQAPMDRQADAHDDGEDSALKAYVRALTHPKTGIPLGTKRLRLSSYRNCFSGAEGVVWFMANMEGITNVQAAAQVGQSLIDLGVIEHVKGTKQFSPADNALYQFRSRSSDKPSRPPSARRPLRRSVSQGSQLSLASVSSVRTVASSVSFGTAYSADSQTGSDVFDDETFGNSPYHLAAGRGDIAVVKQHLEECGPDQLDGSGRTPLMYSVIGNRGKICRLLLKSGADVNARDDNGNTPLIWAACRGCRDAIRVLLRSGADIDCVDLELRSSIHWATKLSRPDCLELLLKHSFKALVNKHDAEQLTALHWAVMCDHPQHAFMLLQAQADVREPDGEGRTVFHYAVSRNAMECLKVLVEFDPQAVNMADVHGRTCLHMAAGEGSMEVLILLLSVPGVDVNSTDQRLTTPLHWAAVCNRPQVCQQLLQRGSRLLARDTAGMTPLHYATERGFHECVNAMQKYTGQQRLPERPSTAAMKARPMSGKGSQASIAAARATRVPSRKDMYGGGGNGGAANGAAGGAGRARQTPPPLSRRRSSSQSSLTAGSHA
eukprot:m.184198 g.184198  ORF g.184198 m.184198 type:complete len:1198 (-) comp18095_c0_seq2:232-3825(-)